MLDGLIYIWYYVIVARAITYEGASATDNNKGTAQAWKTC